MKILFDLTHTTADLDILSSGQEFHVIQTPWDVQQRPRPKNLKVVEEPEDPYDLMIAGSEGWIERCERPYLPLIYKIYAYNGKPPQSVLDRAVAIVFSSMEAFEISGLERTSKMIIIEKSVDTNIFTGYEGSGKNVLCVGNALPLRIEKGIEALAEVNTALRVDLLGARNDGYTSWVGYSQDIDHLVSHYRSYKVYFNPCGIISHAVLEAMAVGMPVVTMVPENYSDLMISGVNCMIAETGQGAVNFLRMLLANAGLRKWIGDNARKSVLYRFHPFIIKEKWSRLTALSANGLGHDEALH